MYETIDLLCSITEQQAQLIRRMSEALLLADIPDGVKEELEEQRDRIESEMDAAEYKLRHAM